MNASFDTIQSLLITERSEYFRQNFGPSSFDFLLFQFERGLTHSLVKVERDCPVSLSFSKSHWKIVLNNGIILLNIFADTVHYKSLDEIRNEGSIVNNFATVFFLLTLFLPCSSHTAV